MVKPSITVSGDALQPGNRPAGSTLALPQEVSIAWIASVTSELIRTAPDGWRDIFALLLTGFREFELPADFAGVVSPAVYPIGST